MNLLRVYLDPCDGMDGIFCQRQHPGSELPDHPLQGDGRHTADSFGTALMAAGYTKAIETRINLMRPVHRSNRRYQRGALALDKRPSFTFLITPTSPKLDRGHMFSRQPSPFSRAGTTFRQGLGAAATAPLDDLNLRRKAVPEVLVEARRDPYSIEHLLRCSDIDAGINDLDDALGPDVDQPQPTTGVGDQAANAALDMVRDTATDFMPLRSWVRRLSGADAHDREVQAAIRAGSVRRGFLKGIAWQRQCPSND